MGGAYCAVDRVISQHNDRILGYVQRHVCMQCLWGCVCVHLCVHVLVSGGYAAAAVDMITSGFEVYHLNN